MFYCNGEVCLVQVYPMACGTAFVAWCLNVSLLLLCHSNKQITRLGVLRGVGPQNQTVVGDNNVSS